MLHEDEGQAGAGGQRGEEFAAGFEAARGGADANDDKVVLRRGAAGIFRRRVARASLHGLNGLSGGHD
jgi:hypothetical protein